MTEVLTIGELARFLGFPYRRVYEWFRNHCIYYCYTENGYNSVNYAVTIAHFLDMARAKPHLLQGVDSSGLLLLLGDDQGSKLIDYLNSVNNNNRRQGKRLKILDTTTGIVYPNAIEAAKNTYFSHSNVLKIVNNRNTKNQGRFVLVPE